MQLSRSPQALPLLATAAAMATAGCDSPDRRAERDFDYITDGTRRALQFVTGAMENSDKCAIDAETESGLQINCHDIDDRPGYFSDYLCFVHDSPEKTAARCDLDTNAGSPKRSLEVVVPPSDGVVYARLGGLFTRRNYEMRLRQSGLSGSFKGHLQNSGEPADEIEISRYSVSRALAGFQPDVRRAIDVAKKLKRPGSGGKHAR